MCFVWGKFDDKTLFTERRDDSRGDGFRRWVFAKKEISRTHWDGVGRRDLVTELGDSR